jgi:hypothetical protein
MIEGVWYVLVAVCCVIALSNWRVGIYLGVLLDCLRDPARKLADDQTVLITLTGVAVWGAVILRAYQEQQGELRMIFSRYPRLRTMRSCLVLAMIPAAALSVLLYPGGWLLAAIGAASYAGPFIGIGLGYLVPRSEKDVYRLFRFYTVLNSVMLVGVPVEYLKYDLPGLGGIDIVWIRYQADYIVELISGFYRSPDIMGLHAAHVVMFSMLLALRSRTVSRFGWTGTALWAAFCLLVSGRRKMIGIPLVFIAVYLFLSMRRKVSGVHHLVQTSATVVIVGAALGFLVWSPDQSAEYTGHATTLFTEGATRANEVIVGSSIGTLQQAGILGAGLGTATQGRYYAKVDSGRSLRGWQEDGVSRLLLEFGVPGFLMLLWAGYMLLVSLRAAFQMTPRQSSEQLLQVGLLSVVAGNAASYAISHQQFSGDPFSGLFATMVAGMVLGAPRIVAARQIHVGQHGPAAAQHPLPMHMATPETV